MSTPFQVKQLIRRTISMFFVNWEMQNTENGCSFGQLVIGSFITTTYPLMHHVLCRHFFGETSNQPDDSAPLQPIFGAFLLLAFPKTKITFEGKRFQTVNDIQENTTGQLIVIPQRILQNILNSERDMGELCEVPRCLIWKWLRCHCLIYNVSYIFFNKCLYFHITWLDTFWKDLVHLQYVL